MSFEDMAAAAQGPKNLPVEFEFDTTVVRTIAKEGQAWFVAKQLQIADWLASRFLETDRAKAPFD
jgi:hypothetical protein